MVIVPGLNQHLKYAFPGVYVWGGGMLPSFQQFVMSVIVEPRHDGREYRLLAWCGTFLNCSP
jgi:hypothetical protein